MKRESTYDDDDIPFDMEGRSGSDDEDDHDESWRSSSFDGTTSSSGSSSTGSSSDDDEEVDSEFRDGFDGLFGKKRLTDDWRRFIHPLKWRCKWVELRVKELYHQASKYDRELLEYDIEKNNSEQLMKRRKRKRIEDMIDSAYFVDDSEDNQDPPVLEFRKDDDSLEQILWRIDALQSHVLKLKIQLEKATFNSTEHPSTENSHLLDSKMGLSHVGDVCLDNPHTRDLSKDVKQEVVELEEGGGGVRRGNTTTAVAATTTAAAPDRPVRKRFRKVQGL
ncbi:hypothetical protein QJS10_CPB22g01504 [Acorus calamus]|uniref:Uncharacterized protein n=1 Tax=Acorus calamus TaxID=4465 RepID=A0AAV9C086_ACOCL|nr:hypothetical protein QJS10_CPB22g01504 [Acorus calamus]